MCRTDCSMPSCGDGIVDAGEQCDLGDANGGSACRSDCSMPSCGDGIVDAGEDCDLGDANGGPTCRTDCSMPFCGDAIVDSGEGVCTCTTIGTKPNPNPFNSVMTATMLPMTAAALLAT